MPTTRLQSGHLQRRNYDLTLQMDSMSLSHSHVTNTESPTQSSSQPATHATSAPLTPVTPTQRLTSTRTSMSIAKSPTGISKASSWKTSPTSPTSETRTRTSTRTRTRTRTSRRRRNEVAREANALNVSGAGGASGASSMKIGMESIIEEEEKEEEQATEDEDEGEGEEGKEGEDQAQPQPHQSHAYAHAPHQPLFTGSPLFPPISFGAYQPVGMSPIARADNEIRTWEAVVTSHTTHPADATLLPHCTARLSAAQHTRSQLRASSPANLRAGVPDPAAAAIAHRLTGLRWALATAVFPAERDNIQCAIRGYESGEIKYSTHFTLLYAGHIVDTAPDYASFQRTRHARLDAYAARHGAHWLWWEPPLRTHPDHAPRLHPAVGLERSTAWSSLGQWHIKQGFWKRAGWVSRIAETAADIDTSLPVPDSENWQPDPSGLGRVQCQQSGPKLNFRSLLDSGATYPSLHTVDLERLGIEKSWYGAQSVQLFQTANGEHYARLYELFVAVLDDDGRMLVDADNPVWPLGPRYLGGLCPVVECVDDLGYDVNGFEVANRLSGLLPFVACYISSTPTRNRFWLGEDRNDVLGAHKMPGHKKWEISMDVKLNQPYDPADHAVYGNPKITFAHRQGRLVDEDTEEAHASKTTLWKGTEREQVWHQRPRQEWQESQMLGELKLQQQQEQQTLSDLQAVMRERGIPGLEEPAGFVDVFADLARGPLGGMS